MKHLIMIAALLCSSASAEKYIITWDTPLFRADGSPLQPSDIYAYELYYMVNDEWVYIRDKSAALENRIAVNLGPGPYKFGLTTVDTSENYSVMSDSAVGPSGTPDAPVIVCP